MKYKLGDFVRFVDEKREGYVTRIFDDQMIGVTGEDDFEIPVLASKVTTVYGHQSAAEQQNAGETVVLSPDGEFSKHGVYLAFINDARAGSVVHFHLINETSFQLLAALTTHQQNKFKGEFAAIIAAKSAQKVYSAQMADLQVWPEFRLNIIFYSPQNAEPPAPLSIREKFKAKDFSGSKKTIPQLKQPGWLIQLDEPELVVDPQKLKESFFKSPAEKAAVEKPAREMDLHIEKLRDDYQFLTSSEIMTEQLNAFHKALDAAIVHRMPEIIFIHGAGNGTLRNEIHKHLGKNTRVQTFMDAQKEKFGYGATRVLLK